MGAFSRKVLTLLGGAAAIYLVLIAYFVFAQRQFIYFPKPPGTDTPARFGLAYREVDIPVPARDGEGGAGTIAAWHLSHDDDSLRPTVHYSHGNGASLSSLAEVAAIFFSFGWDVLLYDYRGYGRSSPPLEGLSELSLQRDALAALDWLRTERPNSPIIVWGHSLGSAVAARIASERVVDGVVLEGAFRSIHSMAEERYPWLLVPTALVLDRFETFRYVQHRSMPLLVAHAENDAIIPLQQGRAVFTVASEPKRFLLLRSIGHNDFPRVYLQYHEEIRSFTDEVLAYYRLTRNAHGKN